MQQDTSPAKFQSLATVVKSLDGTLKTHLETMSKWYASHNLFIDSFVTSSTDGASPNHQKSEQEQQESVKSPSASLTPSNKQGNTNNNNLGASGTLNLSAQLGSGSRMRMRRNTKIPVAFDDSALAKLRRPSAQKATVTVRVVFMKIGIIDTIHDRYSAEVLIQSKWRESAFDNKKQSGDTIDWDVNWNPRLSVENVIGEPKISLAYLVKYDRDDKATVIETRRINGQFFEFMELNQFPFDHQDLTVTVVSEQDVDRMDMILDQVEKCGINAQAFSAEQEWSLEQNVSTWKRTIPRTINKVVVEYPALSVAAKASRRPQFFIWNIIIIMMAICSLAFATFTVNLETPQFRLQLTYILLLTTVTFKFVVNKSLPKISYLTYLDKYILGSMVILCGICVWHAVVGSIIYNILPKVSKGTVPSSIPSPVLPHESNTTSQAIDSGLDNTTIIVCNPQASISPGPACMMVDSIALGVLSFIYIAFHLFFLVLIIKSRRDEDDDIGDGENGDQGEGEDAVTSNHQNGFQINVDSSSQSTTRT